MLLFFGGEYTFLSLGLLDLKAGAGFTVVNIYNGRERGTDGSDLDLGTVTGTGAGGQIATAVELNFSRRFSLQADLGYNFARIDGATFAGAPADPGSVNSNGSVDYSGLMAKIAFNIYLIP
jgi:hypothetical protein